MSDNNVIVRDTTAWTLGRICELVPDAALQPQHLGSLLDALVLALQSDPRVASNACWALSGLAEAAHEKATELKENDEPETYALSPFFRTIVERLLLTTLREDGNQVMCNPRQSNH